MEPTLEDVLRGLEQAADFAKSFQFELTGDYVALIEQVEALAENRPGAHKSGRSAGGRRRRSTGDAALLVHVTQGERWAHAATKLRDPDRTALRQYERDPARARPASQLWHD